MADGEKECIFIHLSDLCTKFIHEKALKDFKSIMTFFLACQLAIVLFPLLHIIAMCGLELRCLGLCLQFIRTGAQDQQQEH